MTPSCGHCGVCGAEKGRHVIWAKQSGKWYPGSGIMDWGSKSLPDRQKESPSLCFLSNALSTEKPFFSRPRGVRCFTTDIFIAWWHKPAATGKAMHNTRLKHFARPIVLQSVVQRNCDLPYSPLSMKRSGTILQLLTVVVAYLAIKVKSRSTQAIR